MDLYRTINYDFDFTQGYNDPNVFKSIVLELGTDNLMTFTGDFPQAWYRSMVFIFNHSGDSILNSSSVNHFFSDYGNKVYKEVYIYNNDPYSPLNYTEDLESLPAGIEFAQLYIPKDMSFNSWEECEAFLNNDNDEGKELELELPTTRLEKIEGPEVLNPITQFFKQLPDTALVVSHKELIQLRKSGVLEDGTVRKIRKDLNKLLAGMNFGIDFVIQQLQEEGLSRFVNLIEKEV